MMLFATAVWRAIHHRKCQGSDRVTLLGRGRLKTTIIGRAGDDHPADPFQDFLTFAEGQAVEIVRQVPGEPTPFWWPDVGADIESGCRARPMRKLGLEIPAGQPVAFLNPRQDLEAFDRAQYFRALHPTEECFGIEGFVGANDSMVQVPEAAQAHLGQRGIGYCLVDASGFGLDDLRALEPDAMFKRQLDDLLRRNGALRRPAFEKAFDRERLRWAYDQLQGTVLRRGLRYETWLMPLSDDRNRYIFDFRLSVE